MKAHALRRLRHREEQPDRGGMKTLSDGKLCKECKQKLSPFFTITGSTNTQQVKEHLAYRERNKEEVAKFNVTQRVGGEKQSLYVDEAAGKFLFSTGEDCKSGNPDVFKLSDVASVRVEIRRSPAYSTIYDYNNRSVTNKFDPLYQFSNRYDFDVIIDLNLDWVKQITFQVGRNRKESSYGACSVLTENVVRACALLGGQSALPAFECARKARAELLPNFHATQTVSFADGVVMVDPKQKSFVIGETADPRKGSDVMMISDVLSMEIREVECSREMKTKGENGRQVSFDPPQYEKTLWYACVIYLKNSWTDQLILNMTPRSAPVDDSLKYRRNIAQLYLILGQDTSQFSDMYVDVLFDRIRKLQNGLQ